MARTFHSRELTTGELAGQEDRTKRCVIQYWWGGSTHTLICTFELAQTFERVYDIGKRDKLREVQAVLGIPS